MIYRFIILLPCLCMALLLSSSKTIHDEVGPRWMSFQEANNAVDEKPKKVLVDVYTDWCGWCKKMDKTTFDHPVIQGLLKNYFYPVKFDAEHKEVISFKNNKFGYVEKGKRGYHELAAALLQGRMSFPSVVLLDEEMNMIQVIPGFHGPKEMEMILTYIGKDIYKEMPWEKFSQEFTSSIK